MEQTITLFEPHECTAFYIRADPVRGEAEFRVNRRIKLTALGFLGPINADCLYEVQCDVTRVKTNHVIKKEFPTKEIYVCKGQTFFYELDEPITVEPSEKIHNIFIEYKITGIEKAWSISRSFDSNGKIRFEKKLEDVSFDCVWHSKRIVCLKFKNIL